MELKVERRAFRRARRMSRKEVRRLEREEVRVDIFVLCKGLVVEGGCFGVWLRVMRGERLSLCAVSGER